MGKFKDTKIILDLISRAQRGDSRAENDLVYIYMPYVEYMVSRYSKKTDIKDNDDLRSYVFLGLIEGIRKFDVHKGTRFIYFAHIWMKKNIFLGESKYRFVRIPVNQKIFYDNFLKRIKELDNIDEEFAEEDEKIQKYLMIKDTHTLSFSDMIIENEESKKIDSSELFSQRSKQEFKEYQNKETLNIIKHNINKILKSTFTEKEIYILEHLFGLNDVEVLSAEQIAKRLNVTKVNITFTKTRMIKLLRHASFENRLLHGT